MATSDGSQSSSLHSAIWAIRSILGLRKPAPDEAVPIPCPASNAWVLETRLARWHARRIIGHMDLRPGMRVLDVGCGVGRFTLPLAASVGPDGRVVALDLQPEMLERLRDKGAAAGTANITAVQGGAGEGKVPTEEFDRALLASVLGEIPADQRTQALREIGRVLGPDGILYVVEVARFDPDYLAVPLILGLLRECGLSAIKVTRIWPAYLMACRVERLTPR
jgi:ubiquinone/menaquinone biosynthesis C-methylase UbiE